MVKHCSIHGDHNEEKCPKCEVTYMEKALKDRLMGQEKIHGS